MRPLEPSSRLQSLRELREIAVSSHMDAQYTLALEYAAGNLGGATKLQVAEFISQVSQSSITNAVGVHVCVCDLDAHDTCKCLPRKGDCLLY